jgi:zinc protease
MLWQAFFIHDQAVGQERITEVLNRVIEQVRNTPVDAGTLARAKLKWRSDFYDTVGANYGFGRADLLASLALFDDNPELINEFEAKVMAVTPEQVLAAAKEYLRPTNRTILTLEAGAGEAAEEEVANND